MKHFIDIEAGRIEDTELRKNNVSGFRVGEHIQITTKVDGSNASICYEDGNLVACSRNRVLDYDNNLNGFFQYVEGLDNVLDWFKNGHESLVIFGEWNLCGNKIKDYKPEFSRKCWIVYDIYDAEKKCYLPQTFVKRVCDELNLTYIHVLYDGAFISWDHVKQFLVNDGYYGETEEGIVIKSQDRLETNDERVPFYVKFVNDAFKESMSHRREKSPEETVDAEKCQQIVNDIVTRRRVEKALEKLRDDGEIPAEITPKDMGIIAKVLPKFVYNDCVKEEKELVTEAGALFGKMCGSKTMQFARDIILGG